LGVVFRISAAKSRTPELRDLRETLRPPLAVTDFSHACQAGVWTDDLAGKSRTLFGTFVVQDKEKTVKSRNARIFLFIDTISFLQVRF
jgi:hypothetical protein